MKKTIITTLLLSTFAVSFALDTDVINLADITHTSTSTSVRIYRARSVYNVYTDSVQSYTLGEFTKVFKGNLTNTQLVDKVSLLADDFLTVKDGTYKVQGQTYKLAKSRSTAFFADGYRGYFAELAKQLENER